MNGDLALYFYGRPQVTARACLGGVAASDLNAMPWGWVGLFRQVTRLTNTSRLCQRHSKNALAETSKTRWPTIKALLRIHGATAAEAIAAAAGDI